MQWIYFLGKLKLMKKGTDYFKSLKLKYVCEPVTEKKREKLALAIRPTEEEKDLGYDDGVNDY